MVSHFFGTHPIPRTRRFLPSCKGKDKVLRESRRRPRCTSYLLCPFSSSNLNRSTSFRAVPLLVRSLHVSDNLSPSVTTRRDSPEVTVFLSSTWTYDREDFSLDGSCLWTSSSVLVGPVSFGSL